MTIRDLQGVAQFIRDYPGMSIGPSRSNDLILKGSFSFAAKPKHGLEIVDSYELEITIPAQFPNALPYAKEMNQKIPNDGAHHVNPDGTLCMGSPLRLLKKIHEDPSITGFAESCLVPYLYAVSYKVRNGGDFVFSELAHGDQGIFDDYCDLFGLKSAEQVVAVLLLLGMEKRDANKKPCPCKCGKRLGKCRFHDQLNYYRKMAPRSWFESETKKLLLSS